MTNKYPDGTNWGKFGAWFMLIMIIIFLVLAFFANKSGMDISEIFRNFMDNRGR